jgi:DnaJ domain
MNAERAYTILDASPGLTPSQLKKKYYKKALLCHPDKQGDPEEFLQVQEAYEYLSQQKDPLPSLFQHDFSIDPSTLLSLYVLLMEFKELVPPILFSEMEKRMPPLIIIHPTLADLVHQHIYLYTHGDKRYSIPMWHHELIYDEFIVLCRPEVELDEDNNLTYEVHAKVQDVFQHGLHVEELRIHVDAKELRLAPFQLYTVQGTIPRIQEDIYSVSETGFILLQIYLS